MKTPTLLIKTLNLFAIISGFTGMLMSVKLPGTISLLPLIIGLLLGLITLWMSKKKDIRCVGCYLAVSLATIGLILTLLIQLTSEPEVAIDKEAEQAREESAEEIEESDDLDDALDELDFE